jgi:5-methyltetrahydropteroyltriglutamate--homocysteine methyltransferase
MTVAAARLRTLRVDQVGSLLRPPPLLEAFISFRAGAIGREALVAAQDDAIRGVVAEQERRGLPVIVDGELRRINFMQSFADVAGAERWQERWAEVLSDDSAGEVTSAARGLEPDFGRLPPITEPLRLVRNRPLEEFLFAQHLTPRPIKSTLLSADLILRDCLVAQSLGPYSTPEELLADIVAVQCRMLAELAEAGCRYVQIDAPNYTVWVDDAARAEAEARGESQPVSLNRAIEADNAIVADAGDSVSAIHLCRGNRQSTWHRSGGYERIAEQAFAGLVHDRLLLEYDSERSGDFAPLRHVPADKIVVLGLISTKTAELESADDLKRRIDEASRYVAIEQLALSPQCGFASTIRGNALSEDDQWRKLELMLEVADAVWGSPVESV